MYGARLSAHRQGKWNAWWNDGHVDLLVRDALGRIQYFDGELIAIQAACDAYEEHYYA